MSFFGGWLKSQRGTSGNVLWVWIITSLQFGLLLFIVMIPDGFSMSQDVKSNFPSCWIMSSSFALPQPLSSNSQPSLNSLWENVYFVPLKSLKQSQKWTMMKMFHFLVSRELEFAAHLVVGSGASQNVDWFQLSTCEINGRKIFHSQTQPTTMIVCIWQEVVLVAEKRHRRILRRNTRDEFLLHFPHNITINSRGIWEIEQINFNCWFEIFNVLAVELWSENRSILALSSTFPRLLFCAIHSTVQLTNFDLKFIFTWFSIFSIFQYLSLESSK